MHSKIIILTQLFQAKDTGFTHSHIVYLQIYNTSLLDKYLQSQLLCLLTHLLLCLTTCFGPTGHHQVITNKHSVHIYTYL
jgi:hypothetical protein